MNSQQAFESTEEYGSLSRLGIFLGFLCGKPIYRKFDMSDVRPMFNCFETIGQSVIAGNR